MNVWLYSIMRDEERLLPYFLRHYGLIADKLIIYDHYSTDRTRELLAGNSKVEIRDFDFTTEMDDPTITAFSNEVYKEARGQGVDFIIWADADEFLYHPHLRRTLERYRDAGVTVPLIDGYTMINDEFPTGSGQITESCRLGVPDDIYSKLAIFSPDIDINYHHGHHRASPTGNVISSESLPIKLLHYRYFGPEYLAYRNSRHYALLSERNKANGWGRHLFPTHTSGTYSPDWYEEMKAVRWDVVS